MVKKKKKNSEFWAVNLFSLSVLFNELKSKARLFVGMTYQYLYFLTYMSNIAY